jgi:predicted phosphodiesterase
MPQHLIIIYISPMMGPFNLTGFFARCLITSSFLLFLYLVSSYASLLIYIYGAQNPPLSPFGPSPDFAFTSVGDMGCNSIASKIVNNMNKQNPNFVLILGDLSYQKTADCWLKLISPIENKTKVVFGGHDGSPATQLKQYMSHFGMAREFYSFDYQNVHFVALATELPYDTKSTQYNFIKNDLETNSKNPQNKWIVVFSYRAQYSSPTEHPDDGRLRDIYHPLFEKYNVDIVLQAHNHNYQRTSPLIYNQKISRQPISGNNNTEQYESPKGQIYVTVGTGGAKLYDFSGKAPFVVSQYKSFGFLEIAVTNSGRNLTGTYYDYKNTIKDHFTIIK